MMSGQIADKANILREKEIYRHFGNKQQHGEHELTSAGGLTVP
jgi:hypothetical protein